MCAYDEKLPFYETILFIASSIT